MKVILDLCGGTGAWSKPYKDAGYDVKLITLPRYDIRTFEFRTPAEDMFLSFREERNKQERLKIKVKDIHGILSAPPCTEFSKAKTTKPRDFEMGMETVQACLEIIWGVQKIHKLAFWALENPEGLLRRFLGNPPYHFRQWWFGNERNKPTDLWGRFNEPKRVYNHKPVWVVPSSHNKNADWYSSATAEKRAITPAGFAQAFFKANL